MGQTPVTYQELHVIVPQTDVVVLNLVYNMSAPE